MTTKESEVTSAELEKPIPNAPIRLIAKYLDQQMDHYLRDSERRINDLRNDSDLERPMLKIMHQAVRDTQAFLKNLQEAREIRFKQILKGWDLEFSPEKKDGEQEASEAIMNSDLTPKFIGALDHNLGNKLSPLNFAEIIADRAESESSRNNASSIVKNLETMRESLRMFQDATELRMSTAENGNVMIAPIKPAVPAPVAAQT